MIGSGLVCSSRVYAYSNLPVVIVHSTVIISSLMCCSHELYLYCAQYAYVLSLFVCSLFLVVVLLRLLCLLFVFVLSLCFGPLIVVRMGTSLMFRIGFIICRAMVLFCLLCVFLVVALALVCIIVIIV